MINLNFNLPKHEFEAELLKAHFEDFLIALGNVREIKQIPQIAMDTVRAMNTNRRTYELRQAKNND